MSLRHQYSSEQQVAEDLQVQLRLKEPAGPPKSQVDGSQGDCDDAPERCRGEGPYLAGQYAERGRQVYPEEQYDGPDGDDPKELNAQLSLGPVQAQEPFQTWRITDAGEELLYCDRVTHYRPDPDSAEFDTPVVRT
jgi:hypothetical protein